MLILGAKGFAKEVLEILHQSNKIENLCFFDDVNNDIPDKLFGKFPIYKTIEEVRNHFEVISKNFIIGVGNPKNRKMFFDKFCLLGGRPYTIISSKAEVGSYDNYIDVASIISSGVIITNSVRIGKGVIINLSSTIGHDCIIGNFVEICPNVSVSGNCVIEENVFIGTGAIVLPGVTIEKNSIVAAGAVVCKSVPPNVMVAGVPAKIIREFN
jgi:sugar O-acyltransferase (sialic acid O-acetyltransferase NeuD family)